MILLAQLIRPSRTNPPVDPGMTLDAVLHPPEAISATLHRACRDCHSSETVWPWYTNVAPISWLIASHVNEGREHFNLSEWGTLDARRQAHRLEEACEQVEKGEMPMESYVLLHGDAALTDADRQAICDWTRTERARLEAPEPAPEMSAPGDPPPAGEMPPAPAE